MNWEKAKKAAVFIISMLFLLSMLYLVYRKAKLFIKF